MSDGENPKTKWVKSPLGVAEYYVNTSLVMWSLDDVRFRLGQLVNAEDNSSNEDFKAVAQERAAVTMSWRNAKMLRNQLMQLIKLYEDTNGEINVDVNLPAEKIEKPT
ncbi:MAG: DUF3467 domain-containing protein [Acidobacteriaceae bacterium]